MSTRFDCGDSAQRSAGLVEAVAALRNGELAVIPTDTVYGLAADAFSPAAVAALQAARGGTRSAPPTVLVGSVRTASGFALRNEMNATSWKYSSPMARRNQPGPGGLRPAAGIPPPHSQS